ncbi:MAG: glycoside hydrolase family 20 zincin-like fold domain-containing protein [Terriglobia bacterium]
MSIPVFILALPVSEESGPGSSPVPIWPIPREIKVEQKRLLLTNAAIVVPQGDDRAQMPGRLLAELIEDQFMVVIPVVVGRAPEGKTPVFVGEISSPLIATAAGPSVSKGNPGPEGYWVQIGPDRAVIAGCDYRGTLYGASSFIQLVHPWGHQSVAVWRATIRDWPFLPVRWVHVFIPGKQMLPFARRYMRDFLLRYKFNGMIMELGGGMRLDSHPEISVGWRRTVSEWYAHVETIWKIGEEIPLGTANRFAASCHFGVGGGAYIEKEDLRNLAALADTYGLEIVPEVQSLTHSYYITSAHRELAEDPDMTWPRRSPAP